jgi:phosphomannomutase
MRTLHDVVKAYDVRGLVGEQIDEAVTWALGVAFAELLIGEGQVPQAVGWTSS